VAIELEVQETHAFRQTLWFVFLWPGHDVTDTNASQWVTTWRVHYSRKWSLLASSLWLCQNSLHFNRPWLSIRWAPWTLSLYQCKPQWVIFTSI
jgi:hypothetical protein